MKSGSVPSLERRWLLRGLGAIGLWGAALARGGAALGAPDADCNGGPRVAVERLPGNPIIRPHMDARMGSNVQGPSLIRVPDWVEKPLGRYYLYFADHKGAYIRLAYADRVQGPWRTHEPGALQLAESHFLTEPATPPPAAAKAATTSSAASSLEGFASSAVEGVPSALESATLPHIASPDAHVRSDRREIVLYYHGLDAFRSQHTRVATSTDGIRFAARPELLGNSYFRAFAHGDHWYAIGMPGVLYRSRDGLGGFEPGPTLFPPTMRHSAVLPPNPRAPMGQRRGDTLLVFWTRVGDAPEHVLLSTVDLDGDWKSWRAGDPIDVLWPEQDWEGADRPNVPSVRDAINVRVRQLRDPGIYEEDGRIWLLYAVAGESGIGIAELHLSCPP
jgi:hypothetical protein